MKTKEQVEEKLAQMKEDLKKYKESWNNLTHYYPSGIDMIKDIKEDLIYITIVNQIEVLKWILKDK